VSEHYVNIAALEPLYAPDQEPTTHRIRAEADGQPAKVVAGRRKTPIGVAQNLRSHVRMWRDTDYPGASDTTRELLHHWFQRDHLIDIGNDILIPFRYYFCQREAIETFIYLNEVRRITTLSGIVAEFSGYDGETISLGVNPAEDRWAKYAFKLATGTGKTKVMSLAIVWSYFHALRESDSPMTKHFVVIAPNLTVFERLKDDFKPSRGGGDIFDRDPLIPVAWRGDWNLSTVLQDEASGAAIGGSLYLTNIHRLYETSTRTRQATETYDWMGPNVSKAKALDTGAALRARVISHQRVMVMNDEAHHLWDPGSAWNEAIATLHEEMEHRGGGLVAQLDFSATPKDNSGRIFQHVVCDTPLGEAVDAGIVKTPVIGKGKKWVDRVSDDASEQYQEQLMVGYVRYKKSLEEWEKSGMKPLLFVMTLSTDEANQITNRLNTDPLYQELNGRTINLHTRLKGKVKWEGGRAAGHPVFIESEKDISDEDLKALRELSRELDSDQNPYRCIVSVLMLREGWDVRNVTTIVPLRPYNSPANILPEQTLGRGLRRMTPAGSETAVSEVVTVVEHPAFASLYREQLSQEGLQIEEVEIDDIPKTTVTIYADSENKDLTELEIELPSLSGGYLRIPKLDITLDDVRKAFAKYQPLKLGEARSDEVKYEGRHLFTNEVVERMTIKLPLLENPIGALAFFRDELETMTGLRNLHTVLVPLLETFLTEILFEEKVDLFDQRLLGRLSSQDVREHIRATFVPLIQTKSTVESTRTKAGEPRRVSAWKPFQVTHSQTHPAIPARNTLFNLVPCNRELEVAMAKFADTATDVVAFCKNAGPQALRVDYLTDKSRLSLYTPDFIIRKDEGNYLLVETKGRVDKDVPLKAIAAVAWSNAATTKERKWEYLYVPEGVFQEFTGESIAELQASCATHLADLVTEQVSPQFTLPFGDVEVETLNIAEFIDPVKFSELPPRYQQGVEHAVILFGYLQNKAGMSLAPCFQPLFSPLDEASRGLMIDLLGTDVPSSEDEMKKYFEGDLSLASLDERQHLKNWSFRLRQTIVDKKGSSPIGTLRWALNYAKSTQRPSFGGIFETVKTGFGPIASPELVKKMERINALRNNYVAHVEKHDLTPEKAKEGLDEWIGGLYDIWKAHN
jgi:type III restriction enzyme